ncbi:MAG TPA: mechanosensitive ion channel domain-containing protein [Gemmatimonadaceae bacterium]|nr:mechanosensitive ion channel domain-containing protein [Gemmatimonadaceae bacterium]
MQALALHSGSAESRIVVTVVLVLATLIVGVLLRLGFDAALRRQGADKARFWADQAISLATLAAVILEVSLLWASHVGGTGGALGLIGAGVAVALQRVITSFAGYLIILRGNVFTVGDRITIAGVRGDVVALGFMQTTVLEMGESPAEQSSEPAMWVRGRQYSGRIVRVTNDKIFDAAVYNYTREFPYVWDEIVIPIHHGADRGKAEEILLDAARKRTRDVVDEARPCIQQLRYRYYVKGEIDLDPRVYLTVTDNWLELALRFIAPEPGVRVMRDALYRDILGGLERAKISIASSTSEVTVVGPVEVRGVPAR